MKGNHQLRNVSAIGTYFQNFLSSLNGYDSDEARNIATMVFEHQLGISRIDLTLKSDEAINADQQSKLNAILIDLNTGRPVQYILGEAWFYGMKLLVDENVLIPRRETEELVDLIVKNTTKPQRIIDFCTGSGCIALALKKSFPASDVTGVDASAPALVVANRNAQIHSLDVRFMQMDLLKLFPTEKSDLIVSNPPYVLQSEMESMADRVKKFEPNEALFVPENDPLVFYRRISEMSMKYSPGAYLYFEINEMMGKEISELHSQLGFSDHEILKDMQGKDRFFKGRVPE